MPSTDLLTATLRLYALSCALLRLDSAAAVTGARPPELDTLLAEGRATANWLRVEIGTEQAKRRFTARYG